MFSISNIAWDTSMDDDVAKILRDYGVSYIDIAPPKYFKEPNNVQTFDVLSVRDYWINQSIEPIGMQALLFGTQGLNVFGSNDVQEKLLEHLSHICRIGNLLGARKLVFGSPKNRDRSHLSDSETLTIAVDFFRRLGDIAKLEDVVICLEPNPECYQANFMINSIDTAKIVNEVDHNNIRMQLDIGSMMINKESPIEIIKAIAPIVHHIHISEPELAPLNINNIYHRKAAEAINTYLPNMPMTIEMLTTNSFSALQQIKTSVDMVNRIYKGI